MYLQHAESAFDVYSRGGERCKFSVCFRFFSTSESKKKNNVITIGEPV